MLYVPLEDEPDDDVDALDDDDDDEQAATASIAAADSVTVPQNPSLRPAGRVRAVAELLCLIVLLTRLHHPRQSTSAAWGPSRLLAGRPLPPHAGGMSRIREVTQKYA